MKTTTNVTALLVGALIATPSVAGGFVSKLVRLPSLTAPQRNSTSKVGTAATDGDVCMIAKNFDYQGGDLYSVSGGPNDCCDHCLSSSECTAYSWTDHAGGTCWLKREAIEAVFAPGAESCVLGDRSVPSLLLTFQCDIPGSDIGSVNIQSGALITCLEYCSKLPVCNVVTWTSDNGGTCYFKTTAAECTFREDAVSGFVFKPRD